MTLRSVVRPKRPISGPWQRAGVPPPSRYPCEAWADHVHGFLVLSAVEVAADKDGVDRGPEYHVSISRHKAGKAARCTSLQAKEILRQFGLDGAEEDNHVPHGIVRNFWRPVADRLVGLECACKAEEPAIVEDQGDYVWRPS